MASPLFFAGTSGMVFHESNKSAFPPAFQHKSRLTYYASLHNSLEVNSSWYKVPQVATVARWAEEVPAGFRFTFKLWKAITHAKDFSFTKEDIRHFMQAIAPASHRKGCLLLQFPPSLRMDKIAALSHLLEVIAANNTVAGWDIALEFRHLSWYALPTFQLAEKYGAAIVLHDMPGSGLAPITTQAPFIYLRFHGPAGNYKGGYPETVLQQFAARIRTWMNAGKKVYVYFNNTMGEALPNLHRLRYLVNG
ncbi:Uncharacterized conserved protein YecE, DUF72 family [Chitinophaga costaii]|uniref:Uncharacterized conserved protein YecE, DUF72 family n=1 Tax=Chitinophaga costaii TaxID=1335309 RepID=A0A1C4FLL3_9BACT|nr:DUF72 domain-containing protein [Chitinophaga costaii]PUZ29970.1 DUF72 domain-containing protein [Chitinophaga costaii]SCC56736.1 Uncharacterized conserved protein YecE, DUF72 family [Chitinophaga costaii]